MARPAEELLEFDRLKEIAAGFSTCVPGRRAIVALKPRRDRSALESEFVLIREAIAYLRGGSELGFGSLADPQGWMKQLSVPTAVLSSGELLECASLAETAASLRRTLSAVGDKFPALAARTAALADFCALLEAIRRAVLPNGEISDDASSELRRIRGSIGKTRDNIQKTLQRILNARGDDTGQDYVTLRNDRFVIPVGASERRSVAGVVHGASATGQTVFVEPLETIELNNRLVQLSEEETAEIGRILAELSERVRFELGALEFAADTAAHLDSVFARGRYAREFDCALPEFSSGHLLRLDDARNPVLETALRRQDRKVVPVSLSLGGVAKAGGGDGGTVMVISGPNTGGKTVALKTVGLAALAAQVGIPVAAERAELPVFDEVLVDIGDEQSITADLSTFSAHMLNLKSMLERATQDSLVLVDEVGTGTAPEEGAALGIALIDEFRKRGALTIATTHHDRLKAYASTTPGIVNAAVEFDEVNLRPTYRLLVGVPGVSSGIEIARRLGVPDAVVERARLEMTPESLEAHALIAYLHRSRDEIEELRGQAREELERLEAERRVLQTEWTERQKRRIAELEKRFAEVQKQLEVEVSRLTADISDRKSKTQAEKSASRRLARIEAEAREETDAAVLEHLSASQQDLGITAATPEQPPAAEELVAGAKLRIRGMKQPVILRRIEGRNAEVQAGPLRMRIPLGDILAIADTPEGASRQAPGGGTSRGISVQRHGSQDAVSDEINVIGETVEEATRRVDKFIDEAALAGKPAVRIIHGHGTGALRRGLAEFLASHPLVERTHAEAEDRGGAAITVVELSS